MLPNIPSTFLLLPLNAPSPVGGHEDLDVAPRVEAVQLVDDLEHRALHLVVAAGAVVEARAPDRVHLVEEYDARLLGARHLEELAHHARALAHVLLDQLAARKKLPKVSGIQSPKARECISKS